jgi:hypothetical protein
MQEERNTELVSFLDAELESIEEAERIPWLCDHIKLYTDRFIKFYEMKVFSIDTLIEGDALGSITIALDALGRLLLLSKPKPKITSEFPSVLSLVSTLKQKKDEASVQELKEKIDCFSDDLINEMRGSR